MNERSCSLFFYVRGRQGTVTDVVRLHLKGVLPKAGSRMRVDGRIQPLKAGRFQLFRAWEPGWDAEAATTGAADKAGCLPGDALSRKYSKRLGGVEHEILYDQAAEVFGWLRESDLEYVSEKLTYALRTAAPGTDLGMWVS